MVTNESSSMNDWRTLEDDASFPFLFRGTPKPVKSRVLTDTKKRTKKQNKAKASKRNYCVYQTLDNQQFLYKHDSKFQGLGFPQGMFLQIFPFATQLGSSVNLKWCIG